MKPNDKRKIGHKQTQETKEKIRQALKGRIPWNKGLTADEDERVKRIAEKTKIRMTINNPRKGKHLTKEHKEKMSKALTGRKHSQETIEKMMGHPGWSKGMTKETDERVMKISKANKGKPCWNTGLTKETDPRVASTSQKLTGRKVSAETGRKITEANMGRIPWNKGRPWTKEEKEIRVSASLKAVRKAPNKTEKYLLQLLNKICPKEYKYVGGGQLIIGGKCPDYMNVNGKKKLIECYGTFWHQGEDETKRIKFFKKYGFDTLIIWEDELKDLDKLSERIFNFTYNGEKDTGASS